MRSESRIEPISLSICVLLSIFLLACGWTGFPPPYTDSINYLIPAIQFSAGKGLVNPVYPIANVIDASGANRFIYNVPLFPWLLGAMLPSAKAQSALFVISIINASSLFLSLFLFRRILKTQSDIFSPKTICLSSICLCGVATSFTGHYGGRPEIIGTFITLVVSHLAFVTKSNNHPWVLGLGLGIIASCLPQAAVLFALAVMIYFSYRLRLKEILISTLVFIFTGTGLFAIVLSFSPYGLEETLQGTFRHMRLIGENLPKHFHWELYFLYTNATFYGLLTLTAIGAVIAFYKKYRTYWQSPRMGVFFMILLVGLGAYFGPASDRTSPIFVFAPFFFCACIFLATSERNRALKIASWTVISLTCVGLLRMAFLFPLYLTQGTDLESARAAYREIADKYPGYDIGISDSLWVLTEDYSKLKWCEFQRKDHCDTNRDDLIILWQQSGHGGTIPPNHIGKLTLIENRYNSYIPKVGPIKLAHSLPDYSFAVYAPGSDNR